MGSTIFLMLSGLVLHKMVSYFLISSDGILLHFLRLKHCSPLSPARCCCFQGTLNVEQMFRYSQYWCHDTAGVKGPPAVSSGVQ